MVSYPAVRAYIAEQCAVRRDIRSSSSGPVKMDVNYVKKTLSAMVEDDGYGGEYHEGAEQEYQAHEGDQDHEETNAIEYLMSFVKGYKGGKGGFGGKGKGKGVGKGGSKFEGTCHHCGIYGHRISDSLEEGCGYEG